MERGSDKHGFRVDDAMAEEVDGTLHARRQTHTDEALEAEPSGEDQPEVDRTAGSTTEAGVPDGMTAEDVGQRSQLATYFGTTVWPATGEQLVAVARERDAPEDVLAQLSYVPQGRSYATFGEVWAALKGGREEHRS